MAVWAASIKGRRVVVTAGTEASARKILAKLYPKHEIGRVKQLPPPRVLLKDSFGEEASTSVRTVQGGGLETNRRRH
jgi:hypothetical protein